jgi:insertion element IS1 protein InsB
MEEWPRCKNTNFRKDGLVSQKNYCWIWIAVDQDGKNSSTARWAVGGAKQEKSFAATGGRHTEHLSPEDQYVISKAETYTVKGYNSLFRHFLARLRRESKCYTKAKYMLEHSVKLLIAKWNDDLAILT